MLTSCLTTTAAVLLAGLVFAGSASAQVRTWNFGDVTAPGACISSSGSTAAFGNTVSCSEQPSGTVNTLAVTAWSNGSGTSYATAAVNYHGTGAGIGVANRTEGATVTGEPHHAMDNNTGTDMLLLSFLNGAQVLKEVTLGWSGTDGDFQVLAYTGASAFTTASISGKTAAQLVAAGNGWNLVSTVNGAANIRTPDISYGINSLNVSSSYWLVSAYNSAFGGSTIATSGVDAIKVLAVKSDNPSTSVSAPGTLALASLGLLAVGGLRRRAA